MYIRKLTIQNLKLIREIELDFGRDGKPRMWTVLVGENGLCKTTILQAIALTAIGAYSANGFQEIIPSLLDRRKPNSRVWLKTDFEFGSNRREIRKYPGVVENAALPPGFWSLVEIEPGWNLFEGQSGYPPGWGVTDPLRAARGQGLPFWFVAGYGTSRSLPVPFSNEPIKAPGLERVASLFDRGRIVGTGFADLLSKNLVRPYVKALKDALLKQHGVLPKIDDLELRGQGGVKSAKHLVESHRFEFRSGSEPIRVPATWLSQGYQATISWIADLVGQMFWDADAAVEPDKMEGLVLVDELDLHLHPLWQVGLVRELKQTFPKVQFVVTTHSPMLLAGFERDEIVHLMFDEEGNVTYKSAEESPTLMTGSQIYENFFGIDKLFPVDLGEALFKYGYLANNPYRSDPEDEEMKKLLGKLSKAGMDPGFQPITRKA